MLLGEGQDLMGVHEWHLLMFAQDFGFGRFFISVVCGDGGLSTRKGLGSWEAFVDVCSGFWMFFCFFPCSLWRWRV